MRKYNWWWQHICHDYVCRYFIWNWHFQRHEIYRVPNITWSVFCAYSTKNGGAMEKFGLYLQGWERLYVPLLMLSLMHFDHIFASGRCDSRCHVIDLADCRVMFLVQRMPTTVKTKLIITSSNITNIIRSCHINSLLCFLKIFNILVKKGHTGTDRYINKDLINTYYRKEIIIEILNPSDLTNYYPRPSITKSI